MRDLLIAIALLLASLWFATRAGAQVPELPRPELAAAIARYEVGVFARGTSETPLSLTQYPLDLVSCNRLPTEDAPDGVANPAILAWEDPGNPSRMCRVNGATMFLSMPIDYGYRVAVRAIGYPNIITGTPAQVSDWAFWPKTWRRAPRGFPCPNGQPGVLFVGENDIDGKPVRLSICVSIP